MVWLTVAASEALPKFGTVIVSVVVSRSANLETATHHACSHASNFAALSSHSSETFLEQFFGHAQGGAVNASEAVE